MVTVRCVHREMGWNIVDLTLKLLKKASKKKKNKRKKQRKRGRKKRKKMGEGKGRLGLGRRKMDNFT